MAGFKPCCVLCELTNPDGTMARLPDIVRFAERHSMPVVTVADLVEYRCARELMASWRPAHIDKGATTMEKECHNIYEEMSMWMLEP